MYRLNEYPIFSANNDFSLFTQAAGVVLIKNGKVLVVRESQEAFFSFPGGTCSDNESIEQTAIREVYEELGLTITIADNPFIFQFARIVGTHTELLVLFHFAVSSVSGKLTLGSDAKEERWIGVNDDFTDCYPNVEYAVRHFLNQYGKNPVYNA